MDINEIISAAKEGRVIVLPCKPVTVEFDGAFGFPVMVGDTVYLPDRDDLGSIIGYNVIKIGVNNFGPFFVIDDEDKEELPIEDIGKDVFLTEKDAEEYLESKENE